MQEWPLLEEAVAVKLDEQQAVVAWWESTVTPRHRPGRGGAELSADRATIPMAAAEQQTGIANETISRWRTRLADRAAYRERLLGAEYRAAPADGSDENDGRYTG
jgi:hypothetical protein